jgi:diguanylate cyclase (GGDEF)-like protein
MKDISTDAELRLNPLTLQFRDSEQEAAYMATYPRGMRNLTRLGLLLGIALLAVFAAWDRMAGIEATWFFLALRGVILASLVTLLAISGTAFYYRNMQKLVAWLPMATALLVATAVMTDPSSLPRNYILYILVMMAAYTVFALQFTYVLVISVFTMALFVMTLLVDHSADLLMDMHMTFTISGAFMFVIIGAWMTDRQRRIGFHIRQQLVAEREESRRMALHDHLTGLANRRLLMERLAQAVARDRRSGCFSVVMFLDLDDFKPINDRFGHRAGDELLVEIGTRLQSVVREVDTLARVGGDEFVIVFEDVKSRDCAELLAERVRAQFSQPIEIDSHIVNVAASIGVTIHPGDGDTPDELLDAADHAMYDAKKLKNRKADTHYVIHAA